ncbi:hypothetical protein J3E72DRAFT_380799, partial [Bipolaris maydis]
MVVNNLELGVAALASAATVVLYNYSGDIAKATAPDHKYQAGEDYHSEKKKAKNFFADPKAITAALLRDYASVRSKIKPHELLPIVQDLLKKGEPIDDKAGSTEKLIHVLTTLPEGSQTRINLTNKLIDTLWDNLQHPPLSYMGGSLKVKIEGDKTEVRLTDTITYKSPENGVEITETMPLRPHAMHQYRTPDGSYNNILSPDLGRAGTPYA